MQVGWVCKSRPHPLSYKPKQSLWRNRLARSAVNRKVGGSSPPRDVPFSEWHASSLCRQWLRRLITAINRFIYQRTLFFIPRMCHSKIRGLIFFRLAESEKKRKRKDMSPTWFEHATFWSGVRRATVAPQAQCCMRFYNSKKIPTTLGIPRRSPIQVLTELDVA